MLKLKKNQDIYNNEFVKEDLTDLLAITDTVISRAGSNAIYEFLTLRIPMLLVPLGLDQSEATN